MGYFSNFAAQYVPYDHDHSDTPPEKQLRMRLEELEARYRELTGRPCAFRYRAHFTRQDLRYILPEHLKSPEDVAQAIELAVVDLADRYGICVREKSVQEVPEMDEITHMQISFLDIPAMKAALGQALAA